MGSDDKPGDAAAREWEALDEWLRDEHINALAFRGDPLEHVAFAHDRHVEWADMVRRLRTRADNASDTLDTLREILGCDAEHGVIDQVRDLVAQHDIAAALRAPGGEAEANALVRQVRQWQNIVTETAEVVREWWDEGDLSGDGPDYTPTRLPEIVSNAIALLRAPAPSGVPVEVVREFVAAISEIKHSDLCQFPTGSASHSALCRRVWDAEHVIGLYLDGDGLAAEAQVSQAGPQTSAIGVAADAIDGSDAGQPATPIDQTCRRCGTPTRGLCGECFSLCWPNGAPTRAAGLGCEANPLSPPRGVGREVGGADAGATAPDTSASITMEGLTVVESEHVPPAGTYFVGATAPATDAELRLDADNFAFGLRNGGLCSVQYLAKAADHIDAIATALEARSLEVAELRARVPIEANAEVLDANQALREENAELHNQLASAHARHDELTNARDTACEQFWAADAELRKPRRAVRLSFDQLRNIYHAAPSYIDGLRAVEDAVLKANGLE